MMFTKLLRGRLSFHPHISMLDPVNTNTLNIKPKYISNREATKRDYIRNKNENVSNSHQLVHCSKNKFPINTKSIPQLFFFAFFHCHLNRKKYSGPLRELSYRYHKTSIINMSRLVNLILNYHLECYEQCLKCHSLRS